MPREVLDAALRLLFSSRLDRPRLKLFGGEPLLAAPLVRRALDLVRDRAPRGMKPDVHLVTNGTRLDERMTRFLASRDVRIVLSFDGVAPAQDGRSPGSFGRLDALLRHLRRDHPRYFRTRVAILATLTPGNVRHLAASFSYFLDRDVRDVRFVPVILDDASWDGAHAKELNRQLAEIVRLSAEAFRRFGRTPFGPFREAAVSVVERGSPCSCGSHSLIFVDVDGTLAPCGVFAPSVLGVRPRAVRRIARALEGPRVTDSDLPSALQRRERRARRLLQFARPEVRLGPAGPCSRCRYQTTCVVCPFAIASGGGRVPAFHCDVNRLFAKHAARFQRLSSGGAP